MTSRTVVGGLMTLVGVACLIWFGIQRSAEQQRGAPSPTLDATSRAAAPSLPGKELRAAGSEAKAGTGSIERGTASPGEGADFPIAAPLNAPGSTVARDLDIVSQLFEAWQSNFPGEGNPVGENAEITAALMGDNRLGVALIPKGHRALNERGELCDRWGTPLRLHQLSGTKMEIQSAGPDRKFATADDAIWTPQ